MQTTSRWFRALIVAFLATASNLAFANSPPVTPTITEPIVDGEVVNAEDVHMETALFSDPDLGDLHLCSDWEIWLVSPAERVWASPCASGAGRTHIHLGDGVFQGSHAGRTSLLASTNYRLGVRHRDNSGDSATQWSAWRERFFSTGSVSTIFPLELNDVVDPPEPEWLDNTKQPIVLPAGQPSASLQLSSASGQLLLEFRGFDGVTNELINPSQLAAHVAVRLRIQAPLGIALSIPESVVLLRDPRDADFRIYLPAVTLPAGQRAYFWTSQSGSTYFGQESQTQPDFSQLARGSPAPWSAPPGFRVEVVATGFQLPVNIAFLPNPGNAATDPLYYVNELYGTIRVVRRNGTFSTYAGNLLNFNPTGDFPGSGEQGLTGLVVDPATGDVFVSLLYDAAPPNGPHYPKVLRMHSNDGGQTAANITTVIDMVGEIQYESHQISNLSIGPDGKLYVHMGDGFDIPAAQDLDTFRGKILRMNLDGSAPADNPFCNAADGINARDFVFAYGFRNPFGGGWRAADGKLYEVENGPTIDRFARVDRGENYGWDGTNGSMYTRALYVWPDAVAPVNIRFVQPQVFGGSGFPASMMDSAFVTESGPTWATGFPDEGKQLTRWQIDLNGSLVAGPIEFLSYIGEGKSTCAALACGPDGLYFSDLYRDQDWETPIDPGANVLRVKFVGAADFAANIVVGASPLTVQFTDASTGVGTTAWNWDFGDGGTSQLQHPVHTYFQDGAYNVRLRITTANGVLVKQRNGYIRVGVTPRVAMIGGELPPSIADVAIADFLRGGGFEVEHFDDEPANRPSANQLAQSANCVVLSSSAEANNVNGEFRTANIPLVFWDSEMLTLTREAICESGGPSGGGAVSIVDNSHPITAGFPIADLPVFTGNSSMNVGLGQVGSGAQLLAYREGSDYPCLVAAEAGVQLLGGYVSPARRVLLFFSDNSFLEASSEGRTLLLRSVEWATNFLPPDCVGDVNSDGVIDIADLALLLAHFGMVGALPEEGDLDGNLQVDIQDLALILARFGVNCP